MIKDFIKTQKGFKIGVGVEYTLILGLSILLEMCVFDILTKWDNKVAVALIAVILVIVGNYISKKPEPLTAFIGEAIALVPIATAIRVVFIKPEWTAEKDMAVPIDFFTRALIFVGIGLLATTIFIAFDFNPFKDKGAISKIAAIVIGCYVLAIIFKWVQFNLAEFIIVAILGLYYGYCWYRAMLKKKNLRGLIDAGCLVFRTPYDKISQFKDDRS